MFVCLVISFPDFFSFSFRFSPLSFQTPKLISWRQDVNNTHPSYKNPHSFPVRAALCHRVVPRCTEGSPESDGAYVAA